MANFHKSEEFFVDCQTFSLEAYKEGFKTRELKCRNAVLDHFPGINLNFLDEKEELEGEPIDAVVEAPSVDPATVFEPVLADPIIEPVIRSGRLLPSLRMLMLPPTL